MSDKSPFTNHEIIERVTSEKLGSWLLKQKYDDGRGYKSEFWVRVVASDRLLTVVGDFDPTTFAFGPEDPISCVYWMGKEKGVNSYVLQKASIGSGRECVYEYDTEVARQEVRDLLEEEKNKEEDERSELFIEALQAGLDSIEEFDGIIGVHNIRQAILDVDPESWEILSGLGEAPSQRVRLAIQALNRLVEILEQEKYVIRRPS